MPSLSAARLDVLLLAISLLAAGGDRASAQPVGGLPLDRPGNRAYEPGIAPESEREGPGEPAPPDLALPPPSRVEPPPARLAWVDALDLRGNESVSDATLLAAARPFLARRLSATDLQQLLVTLTQVYLDRGYVNSGAVLPDQEVHEGVLVVQLVEGRLGEIVIEGTRHFRPGVLAARLRWAIGSPLRVADVEQALRVLESDPRIRRLDARLRATEVRGVARLEVEVDEEPPYRADVEANNDEPPSVGTLSGVLFLADDNLLGLGDRIWTRGSLTEGLRRVEAGYQVPIHPSGTTLEVDGRWTLAEVVQPPFDELDVESETWGVVGGLTQPLFRRRAHDLSVGLHLEHRRGTTSIAGRSVTFAPGPDEGRTRLTILRPHVEWTTRRLAYAFALRSIFSFGLDLPSSTTNPGTTPDARFFSWLGQARGIYRDPESGLELRARLDAQLTDEALLPLEQFGVGGPDTVRGYPRNLLVRDQAVVGSLELRWPVWIRGRGRHRLMVGPFADAGRAWNHGRSTPGERTLSSVGLGAHLVLDARIFVDVEWAFPIRNVEAGDSLQARGLLLSARWSFP